MYMYIYIYTCTEWDIVRKWFYFPPTKRYGIPWPYLCHSTMLQKQPALAIWLRRETCHLAGDKLFQITPIIYHHISSSVDDIHSPIWSPDWIYIYILYGSVQSDWLFLLLKNPRSVLLRSCQLPTAGMLRLLHEKDHVEDPSLFLRKNPNHLVENFHFGRVGEKSPI